MFPIHRPSFLCAHSNILACFLKKTQTTKPKNPQQNNATNQQTEETPKLV